MKKEITKKVFAITLVSIILFSFLTTFVLAQDTSDTAEKAAEATKGALEGFGKFANELLSPLFGEKEMLTRVFFAILLGMIIFSIVSVIIPRKRVSQWIFTLIITSISLIALPSNFLQSITTMYVIMGATILSVIPFIIILIFSLRVGSALIGRITWIFFVFYYFALYLYKIVIAKSGWISGETIPYIFAMAAGLVIFFLLGPIRKALFYGEMGTIKESGGKVVERGKLLHRLQRKELEEVYGDESGNA